MNDFYEQLTTIGVSRQTVDEESRQGGDHPTSGSKWKTYYRSLCFPQWGVLAAQTSDTQPLAVILQLLAAEARNYGLLRAAGHDVPDWGDPPFPVFDHFAGGEAGALIVEHIEGFGPFKARTSPRSLMKMANEFDDATRRKAKASWKHLSDHLSKCSPMDLQLMLARSGRIMIIDPEQVRMGVPEKLADWDDSASV